MSFWAMSCAAESPTLFDRIFGTRVGIKAADLVHEGQFGVMVAQQGLNIVAVPIQDAVKQWKLVSPGAV